MTFIAILFVGFALLCALSLILGLVKPEAMKDSKTGQLPDAKQRIALVVVGVIALVVGLALFPNKKTDAPTKVVAAASPPPATPAPAAKPSAATNQIKPETIVTFPKGEIACLTEDALQAALMDGLSGKETKLNSHLSVRTRTVSASC